MSDEILIGRSGDTEPGAGLRLNEMFSPSIASLHALTSSKWSHYAGDILPAFIAQMDFRAAPPIQEAIDAITSVDDYGYPRIRGRPVRDILAAAFASRMRRKWSWSPDESLTLVIGDVVQGIMACVAAFSEPGDGAIVHTPCYPPFRGCVVDSGRRFVPLSLERQGDKFYCGITSIAPSVRVGCRLLLLCNPHNPVGRVFTQDELWSFANYAIEQDLIVVADEIHADLVYAGSRHIPFASLSAAVAARTITLNSATKSFNIPGLRCAVLNFGSAALKEQFERRVHTRLLGQPNVIGAKATLAAWQDGDPWLASAMDHLTTARDLVVNHVNARLPELTLCKPEATYFAWLDCSALDLKTPAYDFFLDRAKVAFSGGETFDPDCGHFVRLNFATSLEILEEMLHRMTAAVSSLR
jgi:cysteine-S-conjugate beta-lyase